MKTRAPADKRKRLVDAAAKLVHEHGFGRTTLADIAAGADVPLGNVYYYFKTKEAIGDALIDRLTGIYASHRETWEKNADPRSRVEAFIQETIDSRESIARGGCQVGSLCAELHKEGGPLATRAAKLFDDLLKWNEAQFRLMGNGARSSDLAFHLLSALQGASLLANTFHETRSVTREATRLKEWVRSL
jgi:AcrR family transcriptional regulator